MRSSGSGVPRRQVTKIGRRGAVVNTTVGAGRGAIRNVVGKMQGSLYVQHDPRHSPKIGNVKAPC